MDINRSRKESSQHLITLGDDYAQIFKPKSFRCSFCKRGFSNAQALGGHMNIHRKDRAKLREFSDQNFLSLEISRSGDSNDILPPDSRSHDEDDQSEENLNNYVRGILLFAEAAPAVSGGVESKKVELKYGEVDLELRLGPEPHHHAKSKP